MIDTERLQLIPHTPDQLVALMERPEKYEHLAGFPLAAGLRELFVSGEVSEDYLASMRELMGADPWRLGFAVVHPETGAVIGSGGFKGPPDSDGLVEIAYGIAPGYQGRGYATEVARALIDFATANVDVRRLRAHTWPEPNASTKVLTKCGFDFIGEVVDPDDGLVWRWERHPDR